MSQQRREVLKAMSSVGIIGMLAGAGLLPARMARAATRNQVAFDARTLAEALKALGAADATASGDIQMVAPDIAENGAVVPVNVVSTLPGTDFVAVLVEKNPNALAACFELPAGTEPAIAVRVKMQQTSNVVALVRANGKFHTLTKEIKVTLGGCGG